MLQLFWVVVGFLAVINSAMLALFFWDKHQAKRSGRRVPEALMLQIALFGGAPAAKLGQRWFRHKTRKQPFALRLNGIVVLHVLLIVGFVLWTVLGASS